MERIRTTTHSGWYYNRSLDYLTGDHVDVNTIKSFELNYQAAQEGYHDAVLAVGWYYLNGIGVDKNIEEAKKWYRKSARHGEPKALYSLGVIEYLQHNYHDAMMWFERASQKGHIKSLYWIGKLYYKGYGVEQDRKRAFALFHEAAQKNVKEARRFLQWFNRLSKRHRLSRMRK